MEKLKKSKGITLIALVITIIILLILAGVTIGIVIDNGLVEKSQTAVDEYSEEAAKEKLILALFNYRMGNLTEAKEDLQSYLNKIEGIITGEDDTRYIIELEGYEFIVNKDNFEVISNGLATGEKPTLDIEGTTVELSEDKISATIKVKASAVKGGILKVTIEGKEATLENGTYNVTVTENGKYTIIVEESGLTRKASGSIDVTEIETIKYTVTISKGEGIASVTETQEVEEGKSIEITATVEEGYTFSKWKVTSGEESNIENLKNATTKVTPTGNITIEATAFIPTTIIANGNNINGTEHGTITGGDYTYNNPVIPSGFEIVETDLASWEDANNDGIVDGWNNGLVIQDGSGNQFVWVPIDGTDVTYRKWTSSWNGTPTATNTSEDSLPSGVSSESIQIEKYKGFYIARYEAGIPSSLTAALTDVDKRNVSGVPVSKKNQIPWNNITYTNAKANAESMYSTDYVQSGLVTGTMWDTTMKWLENAGNNVQTSSIGWGNYKNAPVTGITQYSTGSGTSWTSVTSTTKGTSTRWLLKTGHTEYTNRNNIYDLAGNLYEWTNEIYSGYRVHRGGYFNEKGTSYPAAYRHYSMTTYKSTEIGFRVVIYVM